MNIDVQCTCRYVATHTQQRLRVDKEAAPNNGYFDNEKQCGKTGNIACL